MEIKQYSTLPEESKKLRAKVFLDEQGFSAEFDEIDDIAVHMVLYIDNKAAAVCRVFYDENKQSYMIGRVAVEKEYRSQHLGAKIMQTAESYIKQVGGTSAKLSAQCRMSGFYKKLGYNPIGEEYLDEFCPHIMMFKEL